MSAHKISGIFKWVVEYALLIFTVLSSLSYDGKCIY